ncbi:MAG: DUF4342 domain-containing protein [Paracoccaceae bacterium]
MEDKAPKSDKRTIIDVIEVTGGQLIDKIKEIIKSGNVRTLRLRAGDDFSLEMPVTVGAIAGGVVVLAAPWLAIIGVIAAMITDIRIEVERDAEDDTKPAAKDKTDAT